ncbi:TonB-dependent siderophore receptor [Providencia rettgeri]|uniref:TonB-dependent siderophore receptor n=1 Tax=Providencia sp. PROV158 TaxID=2949868 RepID=UPI00234B3794|nr:TonB-dependent siderophore receptor [Providencia sp. PROV158]
MLSVYNIKSRGIFRLTPCALLCATVSWSVQANTELVQPKQDVIQVTASSEVDDDYVAPGVTTLGKMALKPREVAQSVSVIDREQIEKQNLQTLDDVMQRATGVTSAPYVKLTTAYYVRGFQIDSFEIDGVPALLGNMASSPQDMAVYERVEILRGSNGLLHGMGNPAATVNMVRKHAPKKNMAKLSLSAGSWERYRGEVDVGGLLNQSGSVRGRFVMAWEDKDYFYDVSDQQTRLMYGTVDIDITPDTLLRMGAQFQTIDSVTNMAGVPFGKDGSDLHLPRKTYLDVDWDRFKWDTSRSFAGIEHKINDDWQYKLNAEYQHVNARLLYAGAWGNIDPVTGDGAMLMGGAYKFRNEQTSLDTSLNGKVDAWGLTHDVVVGASYSHASEKQYSADLDPALNVPVNVYRWDPHSVPKPNVGAYSSAGPTKTTQKGLYGMGRIKVIEPVTVIAGVRDSWWDVITPTANFTENGRLTPYGGVIWDFTPQWSWYSSYSTVYQPQTGKTWSGKMLKPVEGQTLETGVKGALFNGGLNLSGAIYQIDIKNNPQIDPAHPTGGFNNYFISGGKVRSQGFELEGIGYLTPFWDVSVGYTYTDTKYRDDSQNKGESYNTLTPRHMLRVWSNYDLPWNERKWSLGGGMQAQSAYSTSNGNVTLRQGGYAIFNARLGYQIDETWTAAVNVNNVFDRRYYSGLFSPQWNNRYGDPRNVMFTLKADF